MMTTGIRHRLRNRRLGFALGARIVGGGLGVRPDGRDMHEPGCAGSLGGLGHQGRPFGLHGVEALLATFKQDAHEVHDRIGALHGALDGPAIAQIGLHGVHLPDGAHRLDVAGKVRPAHRNAHAIAFLGQFAHHIPSKKARSAKHGDELAVEAGIAGNVVHGRSCPLLSQSCRGVVCHVARAPLRVKRSKVFGRQGAAQRVVWHGVAWHGVCLAWVVRIVARPALLGPFTPVWPACAPGHAGGVLDRAFRR